ncbi:hypothetical protein INT48_005546 [Thamnidium elegans]|uniref:Uncharacterized protein n=1 Tax=Thamnidium elegans TaxID=101142 RepID=A0A8H7SZU1_9FUNG|nr:hypothetical protein INT48_005546 [Thamnidium elegans]
MDRCTGKTGGVAFAEVIFKSRNMVELRDVFNRLEKAPLQGRRLRICLSNYDHLREKLFYDWPGKFKDGVAVTSSNEHDHLKRNPDLFVCQKDFQSLQNVCRNFKLCYNRKCPERSFEYLMSLIMNIPWLQTKAVVTWQRDLIAALLCDGFTIKQKFNIVKISQLDCPEDLLGYITEVEPAASLEQSTSTTSNTTL